MNKENLIKQVNSYLKSMKIETHFSEDISLNDLANELNIMRLGYDKLLDNLLGFIELSEKIKK